jgi:hypothetical protein
VIIPVVVTVEDEYLTDLVAVVDALRAAGLRVGEVLAVAGVVTGTAERDRMSSLSAVPGVAAVEAARTFGLPPPDASTQ